ncbi:hypothetical protein V1264_018873 [Littorina saxatilis]|uniref:G-protein coupled receptors family 1 profile domain-containing protein n=2 Tax=Littorina saxatilis TaxID=31220 RepID=A0AAN9GDY2_9CAEN
MEDGSWVPAYWPSFIEHPQAQQTTKVGVWLRLGLLPLILLAGFLGNGLTMALMLRPNMRRHSYSPYLIALAVSDSVALFVRLIFWLNLLAISLGRQVVVAFASASACAIVEYACTTNHVLCSWIVVCLTSERVLVVAFPLKSSVLVNVENSVKVVAFVVLFCLLLVSYVPVIVHWVPEAGGCVIPFPQELFAHFAVATTFVSLLPLFLICCGNLVIVIVLYRQSRQRGKLLAGGGGRGGGSAPASSSADTKPSDNFRAKSEKMTEKGQAAKLNESCCATITPHEDRAFERSFDSNGNRISILTSTPWNAITAATAATEEEEDEQANVLRTTVGLPVDIPPKSDRVSSSERQCLADSNFLGDEHQPEKPNTDDCSRDETVSSETISQVQTIDESLSTSKVISPPHCTTDIETAVSVSKHLCHIDDSVCQPSTSQTGDSKWNKVTTLSQKQCFSFTSLPETTPRRNVTESTNTTKGTSSVYTLRNGETRTDAVNPREIQGPDLDAGTPHVSALRKNTSYSNRQQNTLSTRTPKPTTSLPSPSRQPTQQNTKSTIPIATNTTRKPEPTSSSSSSAPNPTSSGDQQVRRVTFTLLAVSLSFLLLVMPNALLVLTLGLRPDWSALHPLLDPLALLWDCNFAINFYLYVFAGASFRTEVLAMVGWRKGGKHG